MPLTLIANLFVVKLSRKFSTKKKSPGGPCGHNSGNEETIAGGSGGTS
ncbi:MAG: hypothetical protein LBT47_07055 [Deltaproteobacteria bacterium]|nr:hypothetical protein [Deltaproteobacteria bacterium]